MIVSVAWWTLIAAGVLLEIAARRRPERLASLGRVLGALAVPRLARVALWVAWIFLGVHFFARYGLESH